MNLNYIGHNQWDGHNFPNFYKNVISKKWDKIILFCQNEWAWHHQPRPYFAKLLNHARSIGEVIHVITAAHPYLFPEVNEYAKLYTKVYYWDTYWLGKTYAALINTKQASTIDPFETPNYKYHFISMNRRPHAHRLLLIDLLAKHNLIENNAVSLHHNDPYVYTWKYFEFKNLVLEPEFLIDREQHRVPQHYYDSFAQLISESSGDTIMLSEKTAIPLIIGKPFLVATQMHFHKFLKLKGFELYEEIFDYSFDDEPDETKRYEMLLENFIKLKQIPLNQLPDLLKKVAHKIEFNKRKAREIIYDLTLYPELALEVIDYYDKTGIEIDPNLVRLHVQLLKYKDSGF